MSAKLTAKFFKSKHSELKSMSNYILEKFSKICSFTLGMVHNRPKYVLQAHELPIHHKISFCESKKSEYSRNIKLRKKNKQF